MARTLADMTPEERQACVGMWCDVQMMGGGTAQFVFSKLRPGPRMGAYLTEPGEHMPWTAEYEAITPRFDLMRAWNPDGTPVVMRQEWAARLESGGASIARTRAEAEQAHARHREWHENHGTGPYDMLEPPPPAPAGIQHRFTTEWEATDE